MKQDTCRTLVVQIRQLAILLNILNLRCRDLHLNRAWGAANPVNDFVSHHDGPIRHDRTRYMLLRWNRERHDRRPSWWSTADPINNVTIAEYDSAVRKNVTEHMFWFKLIAESRDIGENIREFRLLLATAVFDLIAHSVKVSTDLILLFALSLGESLGIAKSAPEAVVLHLSLCV